MKYFRENLLKETENGIVLTGQKCKCCGKIAYPKRRVCPECFSDELDEYIFPRQGILHTYTCTYLGAPHLESPYIFGFVDFPEGIRVPALLTGCDPEGKDLHCDMPVEMVVDILNRDENGEDIYAYKFRPMKEAQV